MYPKRPQSHVTGDHAVSIFKAFCPPSWIISPITNDYGVDLRVELISNGLVTGEEFLVQIKGKQSLQFAEGVHPSIRVEQATINYWLGKLHPTMVVLVDTTKKRFWFDWIEYAYREFPKIIDAKQSCRLKLGRSTGISNFQVEVEHYVQTYFRLVRADVNHLFENTQIIRVLFHTASLHSICGRMANRLQTDVIEGNIRFPDLFDDFFLHFSIHDEFLGTCWKLFRTSAIDSSQTLRFLLPKMSEYQTIREKFFMRRHIQGADDEPIQFVPVAPSMVKEHIFSIADVLWEIEETILQMLVLGKIVCPPLEKMPP